MAMRLLRITICFAMLLGTSCSTMPDKDRHFADVDKIFCAQGTGRMLPGDYYFCAGSKALQAGNTRKAVNMYEIAAAWSDKRAMFNLGLLLVRGEGVPRNEPLGLAWLGLAAERNKDKFQREVAAGAWQAATPETRNEASALWEQMKAQYADSVALTRAQKRYERETETLRRDERFVEYAYIEGMGPPARGFSALAELDQIAEETIQRPRRTRTGKAITGDLVPNTSPAPPPASTGKP